jgi:isopenicillin-N N-acyltransferase-like protein
MGPDVKIPVISVSGTPYEVGFAHGEKAKQRIDHNVEFYLSFWNYFSGVEPQRVFIQAQQYLPYIEKLDPELIEEMQGVADGSERPFEEILALNCRWELNQVYTSGAGKASSLNGCTAFAITPEATRNQHTFIGQNWDSKPHTEKTCIVLRINQEKRPDIIISTEAGIIGHKGFNAAGIGVCLNFIRCELDGFKPGPPFLLKVRSLLNCEVLSDCIRTILNFEGPNSGNMVIAHREGEAIDIECLPDDNFFIFPHQGILTHANHFLSPKLRVKDTGKSVLPDTVLRNHRINRFFHNEIGRLDYETIKTRLKDHFSHPNSICRHEDEGHYPFEQWKTITSIVIDLTEFRMYYTSGPPCDNPYEPISMEGLA